MTSFEFLVVGSPDPNIYNLTAEKKESAHVDLPYMVILLGNISAHPLTCFPERTHNPQDIPKKLMDELGRPYAPRERCKDNRGKCEKRVGTPWFEHRSDQK